MEYEYVKDVQKEITARTEGIEYLRRYAMLITDMGLREFLKRVWECAPGYFFIIPASTSLKYHPAWACEEKGLLRHTAFGMCMGNNLAETFELTEGERNIAVTALGVHDTLKYGIEFDKKYHEMHPYLPRSFYGGKHSDYQLDKMLPKGVYDAIMTSVERHMGSLGSGKWGSVAKVKPENRVEMVVHLADFVVSRKNIGFTEI